MSILWDAERGRRMGSRLPVFDIIPGKYANYVPEKGLLAAVLERAYRDLKANVEQEHRRTAISWFLCRPSAPEEYPLEFTFGQITEELELNAFQVDFLIRAALKADKEEDERIRFKRLAKEEHKWAPWEAAA